MKPTTRSLLRLNWSAIRQRALEYSSDPPANALEDAIKFYSTLDWQPRFFAVIVLGNIAISDRRALGFLYSKCGDDPSWQVNEGLAMAFDYYCAGVGYRRAIPTIRKWLTAKCPNLRRAVSEGLRPWTANQREYFSEHPDEAIELLGTLKDDCNRKVQESLGNALRDISRKHPDLVARVVRQWIAQEPESMGRNRVAKLALRHVLKQNSLRSKSPG